MTTKTQDLKSGDRVRVVLEGVVQLAFDNGTFDLVAPVGPTGSNWIVPAAAHVVSVEKLSPPLPPLPTTPGSVVRRTTIDGPLNYVLQDYSLWSPGDWNDDEVKLWDAEVIFDAGAGK